MLNLDFFYIQIAGTAVQRNWDFAAGRIHTMKEWTREEKYRVLKDPQELWELQEKTAKSDFRQT